VTDVSNGLAELDADFRNSCSENAARFNSLVTREEFRERVGEMERKVHQDQLAIWEAITTCKGKIAEHSHYMELNDQRRDQMEQGLKNLGTKLDDTVRYVNDAVKRVEFTAERIFDDLTKSNEKII